MTDGSPVPPRFLVLVTGPAAAGKTTLAPQLAERLDALWISRDEIHTRVYSGWVPRHPARSYQDYDPQIDDMVFREGRVVWSVFLWMLERVTTRIPVVADTPFNHSWNREMFAEAQQRLDVPVIEVALTGSPDALLQRARHRAALPGIHEIKTRFAVRDLDYYAEPRPPLVDDRLRITVDTTDLGAVDVGGIAREVRARLTSSGTA